MRAGMQTVVQVVVVSTVGYMAGCSIGVNLGGVAGGTGGGGMPSASATFDLSGGLETFDVVAGEESRAAGTGNFDVQGASLAGGSIDIDPEAITVTPTGGPNGKVSAALQGVPPELGELCMNQPLVVTVWVDAVDQVDNVFASDQVYTADVTLSESCQPTSVDVTPDALMQRTVDLIEGGELAIGISVVSPVTGTVVIDRLSFGLEFQGGL